MALLRGVGSGVRTMMKEGLGGGGKYGIVEGRGEWGANHDEGRVGGGEVWHC